MTVVQMGLATVALCTQGQAGWSIPKNRGRHIEQLTRRDVLQKEGGHRNIRRTEKKSNAYFGKSLVRLACNQEKNKEKSDRKKWNKKIKLQEETAERTNRRAEQSLSDGPQYHMVTCGGGSSSSSSKESRRAHCVVETYVSDLHSETDEDRVSK